MMKKQRLLAVDDNINLIDSLKTRCQDSDKIEIVLEAHDGEEAFEIIKNKSDEFDVILLDLIMPKKDGLYVLEEMKEENIFKNIILLTSFNSDEMIRKLSSYNIKYFLIKPFNFETLEDRVLEATSEYNEEEVVYKNSNNDLKIKITKLLHELGVPSNIKGYQYIREGILILYENPSIIGGITKELYPEIARKI